VDRQIGGEAFGHADPIRRRMPRADNSNPMLSNEFSAPFYVEDEGWIIDLQQTHRELGVAQYDQLRPYLADSVVFRGSQLQRLAQSEALRRTSG
jgi:hypothetical protein